LQHIGSTLSHLSGLTKRFNVQMDATYFLEQIPELRSMNVTQETIERSKIVLMDYIKQMKTCSNCTGFVNCGKVGDAKGMIDTLEEYNQELIVRSHHCKPYLEWTQLQRVDHYKQFSGNDYGVERFRFDNFPAEQRKKFPKLFAAAVEFAEAYQAGEHAKGLYIFGPAGVGKTHLLLAIVNRLTERRVPCIFIRAEAIFDKLRSLIAAGQDIEPIIDAYCQVPVLAIDEFAQERANEFTIDRIFRIINYRFNAQLPTLFTSNYEPPAIYNRVAPELQQVVDALKSRIVQMNRHGKLDGDDARLRDIQILDF
jgi:primosomal protein DnaI